MRVGDDLYREVGCKMHVAKDTATLALWWLEWRHFSEMREWRDSPSNCFRRCRAKATWGIEEKKMKTSNGREFEEISKKKPKKKNRRRS